MSVLNPLAREISAKIVYYGPGLSGKTTTLKHIYSVVKPQRRGEMVTLATEGDRTIFFDFLPLHVKSINGLGIRFQLYTVPGQVFYEATRKLVLQGADGVVFVADSQPAALEDNLESLDNLKANLKDQDTSIETVPLVLQYNKRDLEDVMSLDRMSRELNTLGAPEFATSATHGDGILEALREISKRVIRSLWENTPRASSGPPKSRPTPAEGIEAELSKVTGGSTPAPQTGEIELTDELKPTVVPNQTEGALTFATLWEGGDAATVAAVESAIREGDYGRAMGRAVTAMVELLSGLPGTSESATPMAKAALLGLHGREFLRFCRLAGRQPSSISRADALFALYLLVSARFKVSDI